MSARKIKKGFTLIELLVVIAIIALLLAIILPSLQKVKEKAKIVVCANNQHQIITAVSAYAASNDLQYPPYGIGSKRPAVITYQNGAGEVRHSLYRTLGGYLGEAKIYNCPLSSYDNMQFNGFSYQKIFEDPTVLTNKVLQECSYNLLWNWNSRSIDPTTQPEYRVFEGPSKNTDTKLAVTDAMFYQQRPLGSEKWRSSHPFKRFNEKPIKGSDEYFLIYGDKTANNNNPLAVFNNNDIGDVKLNAGYTDGRVVRYRPKEGVIVVTGASYYDLVLPRSFR